MLKRIFLIAVGILLLAAVGLGVMRFILLRRTPTPPVGTLTPDEQDESPLISGDGEEAIPLFSGSPTPDATVSGGTSSGTIGLTAHSVCAVQWGGKSDGDKDELPDTVESRYGTDLQKADTDGDGFPDGAEVKSGYDPKAPGNVRLDSDRDGLLEHEECQWKTDPFRADSDGDTFPDGDEVRNGFDPTIKGDGKGSDALPLRKGIEAEQALRPDPNSSNYTEGVAGIIVGDQPVSQGSAVPITPERVQEILSRARLDTTLPAVKITEINVTTTNTTADIRRYLSAIDGLSTSTISDSAIISNAVSGALNGQTQAMRDFRSRLQQYTLALQRIDTPPSAVEHHTLFLSLLRFMDSRLGAIEQFGASDPARAYIAARELQESFVTHLPRLRTLRTALDTLAAG